MMLHRTELERFEREGSLVFGNRLPFSEYSLDIRLERLYAQKEIDAPPEELLVAVSCSDEEFIARHLTEVQLGTGFTPEPNRIYWWLPAEDIAKGHGFSCEVTSRSSWARVGIAVASGLDHRDPFCSPAQEFRGKPLLSLQALGTAVSLREGDAVGQLFVRDASFYNPIFGDRLRPMLDGDLHVERNGERLIAESAALRQGVVLTYDDAILRYVGGTIRPEAHAHAFVPVAIREKTRIPRGAFFLSASAEHVAIPPYCIGRVNEHYIPSAFFVDASLGNGQRPIIPSPMRAHAHAPYIGPKPVFSGKIVFENLANFDCTIRAGCELSELTLEQLTSSVTATVPSRYDGQTSVTASRV